MEVYAVINKKIAIMQPYIFPYLGYFQLINSVDEFVFYDDVNFIKNGWINRNKILLRNEEFMLTIPCVKISSNKLINEVIIIEDKEPLEKVLKTIKMAYCNAPFFDIVYPMIEQRIMKPNVNVSDMAIGSINDVLNYLEIDKIICCSSELIYNHNNNAQDKIISICKYLGANEYINMVGGRGLYNNSDFLMQNISLKFLKPILPTYKQFTNDFIGGLSIIDVLMFNSKAEIIQMLNHFMIEV